MDASSSSRLSCGVFIFLACPQAIFLSLHLCSEGGPNLLPMNLTVVISSLFRGH